MTASGLDARYGRTPARRARTRLLAILAAIGVALVVGAWVVWVGLLGPTASVEAKNLGFATFSDTEIEVRWQLTAPPGSAVSCAVKAVSAGYAVVGWRIVEVEPSDQAVRVLTETLRTSEPPDGGSVPRCWLTDA